mmetsp:Transcript_100592/g.284771  ORF Transcript_100592/g.284771 Transcript_100592/m.284771 type:complete len:234 (-) Transcript_100592:113-814(-)
MLLRGELRVRRGGPGAARRRRAVRGRLLPRSAQLVDEGVHALGHVGDGPLRLVAAAVEREHGAVEGEAGAGAAVQPLAVLLVQGGLVLRRDRRLRGPPSLCHAALRHWHWQVDEDHAVELRPRPVPPPEEVLVQGGLEVVEVAQVPGVRREAEVRGEPRPLHHHRADLGRHMLQRLLQGSHPAHHRIGLKHEGVAFLVRVVAAQERVATALLLPEVDGLPHHEHVGPGVQLFE